MTDKEQIEEMVRIIDKSTNTTCYSRDKENTKCGDCENCWTYSIAKILYNAGYRKDSETAKEIFSLLLSDEYICYFDVAVVKEIAEKYNIQI